MLLEEISESVLSKISMYFPWGDPFHTRLWKTGNKRLMAKMSNRGIRRAIFDRGNNWRPVFWPTCISHWKLTILFIRHGGDFKFSRSTLQNELMHLPPTVTRLDFIFHGSVEMTFVDPSKNGSLRSLTIDPRDDTLNSEFFPRRSTRARRRRDGTFMEQSLAPSSSSPFAPELAAPSAASIAQDVASQYAFAKVFPNLDHFYLGAWGQNVPEYVFAQLPRTMNSFYLWEMSCNISSFADLPPQLTVLHLPYCSISAENIGTLPHTITDVGGPEKFDSEARKLLRKDARLLPNLKNRDQIVKK